MKVVISFWALLIGLSLYGAAATWTGIFVDGVACEMAEGTMQSELGGLVRGEDGAGASIIGMFYTHEELSTMRLKAYDYSVTAAPVNTKWLLAVYGDILGSDTMSSFKAVEPCDYPNCDVGGDIIEDPNSFYLAFVAEDWDDYVAKVENPHVWYGWANCAVNADGALDVLASGINLDGGPVRIGGDSAIPEPSACLLMVMGIAALGLRRRWRMENESGKRKMGGRLTGRNFRFSPERHCGIIGANE